MFQAALTRLLSCSPNLPAELTNEARTKLCLNLPVYLRKAQLPEQDQDRCRCGTSEALGEPVRGQKGQEWSSTA